MPTKERTQILDHWEIEQKIRRMAHEIFEDHYKEKNLVVVGVKSQGVILAQKLVDELRSISSLELDVLVLDLHKDKPLDHEMHLSGELESLRGKVVLLVDDVLNSGRTLIYGVRYLLGAAPRCIKTVVLADRFHRTFPVRADYVGMTLSTNIKEHVEV
ncbi:MAG: hypothetical protein RL226_1041, partial [Bacteroidota bacterium]